MIETETEINISDARIIELADKIKSLNGGERANIIKMLMFKSKSEFVDLETKVNTIWKEIFN